jgi:outer membrane protein OmpA-like peptidoglycan-associated protein
MHIKKAIQTLVLFAAASSWGIVAHAQEAPPQPAEKTPAETAEEPKAEPAPEGTPPVAEEPKAEPAPEETPAEPEEPKAEPAGASVQAAASLDAGPSLTSAAGKYNHEKFNLRFAGGVAFGVGDDLSKGGYGDLGGQGAIGMDWVLIEPLALSILATYTPFGSGDDNRAIQDLAVGAGLRLRLFPGTGGPVNAPGGTIAGDLFLDAHFAYHNYRHEDHGGYNIGLGYELALAKRFNLGPYARFHHVFLGEDTRDNPNYMMFAVGLQISVGAQMEPDDADKDGIPDDQDKCPNEPEDKDGFEDEDGCPDADNDGDGVPDAEDKCPNESGDPANQGCPTKDRDGDGIPDEFDQCPDEAEDKDGFEDEDGCPDLDNDGDGIPDDQDKCPNESGVTPDGCPVRDRDGDGIPDDQDKCPDEPETKNGFEDEDGCPDEIPEQVQKFTGAIKGISFGSGKANILPASFATLDAAVAVLQQYPTLKLAVRGHTDDRGKLEANNELSQARAQAVKDYVVGKGIDEARIKAEGLGPSEPVGDNKTAKGRAENRRIEFKIIVD